MRNKLSGPLVTCSLIRVIYADKSDATAALVAHDKIRNVYYVLV